MVAKITAIDEEGGFINNSFKEFFRGKVFALSSVKLTDKIFTWGIRDYKKFTSYFSKYKNRFSVTGNPRVDFWRKGI